MSDPSLVAEAECRRLVIDFAHHIDHRRFDHVAELFADDGVWDRHGERLVGPEAILAVLNERGPEVHERHVMSTMRITPAGVDACDGESYVLIFRATGVGDKVPATPTPVVGEFHDRFRLTDRGWRIAYRTSVPAFSQESK